MRNSIFVILLATVLGCGSQSEDGATAESAQSANDEGRLTASAETSFTGAVEGVPRQQKKTILFVGTSLTAGYGLDPDSSFPALIQRKIDSAGLPYVVRNAGESGETSAGTLRRIGWLLRDSAAIVVLETGANDGLRGLNPDSTRANIRAVVARIRSASPEARVILAGMEAPPNLGAEYTRRFREIFREVAREENVELIPFLLEGVAGQSGLNQGDGIHPNEEGAVKVAELVWLVLRAGL